MSSKVLGTGGFGCVLYPALVLSNAINRVVTEANKNLYVTKIARDAEAEYDVAKYIESLAPDAGIYPVDLACGISSRNVRKSTLDRIRTECGTILSMENKVEFFRESPRPSNVRSYSGRKSPPLFRLRPEPGAPLRPGGEGVSGGESEWCAVQYPKYDYTLAYGIETRNCELYDVETLLRLSNGLVLRLKDLHAQGVYHLDIKPLNVAVVLSEQSLKFADWGLSVILPKELQKFLSWTSHNNDFDDALDINDMIQVLKDFDATLSGVLKWQSYHATLMPVAFSKLSLTIRDQLSRAMKLFKKENFGVLKNTKVPRAKYLIDSIVQYFMFVDWLTLFSVILELLECKGFVGPAHNLIFEKLGEFLRTFEGVPFDVENPFLVSELEILLREIRASQPARRRNIFERTPTPA